MRIALEWAPAAHLAAFLTEGEDPPTPELPDWLIPVWRAWHRLHLDRPYLGGGMGPMVPGRIPWGVVKDWAAYHETDLDFLDFCIREMDNEFLEFSAGKGQMPMAPGGAEDVSEKIARATAKLKIETAIEDGVFD